MCTFSILYPPSSVLLGWDYDCAPVKLSQSQSNSLFLRAVKLRVKSGLVRAPSGLVRRSPGYFFGKLARWNPKSTESWPEEL